MLAVRSKDTKLKWLCLFASLAVKLKEQGVSLDPGALFPKEPKPALASSENMARSVNNCHSDMYPQKGFCHEGQERQDQARPKRLGCNHRAMMDYLRSEVEMAETAMPYVNARCKENDS